MRHVQLLLIFVAFACQDAVARADDPLKVQQQRTRITLHLAPLTDLHQHVRAVAGGNAQALPVEGFAAAVHAAGVIGPLSWGLIEGNMLAADDAAALLRICEQLPESIHREGREVTLRDPAVAYAHALMAIEEAFLRDHWPARQEKLQAARASIESTLLPHEERCFAHLIQAYAMDDPRLVIPVHLVSHAPSPGAVTYRTRRGSECIVAVNGLPPMQLAEIVLHEASHALDVATMRQATALMQMRRALQAAGVAPTDPRHRDIWHTIMFIQSAETIRRIVEPSHVDYGDSTEYYARVAEIAKVQRPIWSTYLDGEIELTEAIDRIVSELSSPM